MLLVKVVILLRLLVLVVHKF